MEADLAFRNVDYRDRWRYDEHGRPLLTLRRLAVLVRHLPETSAVAAVQRDGPRWSLESHLLDDIRITLLALAGVKKQHLKPHPARPSGKHVDPARALKMASARRRAHDRRRRIEAGEIT